MKKQVTLMDGTSKSISDVVSMARSGATCLIDISRTELAVLNELYFYLGIASVGMTFGTDLLSNIILCEDPPWSPD